MMMAAPAPPSAYVSPAEAAAWWGISRLTVYRLCRRGALPGVMKAGGQWRIPRATLDDPTAGKARQEGRADG